MKTKIFVLLCLFLFSHNVKAQNDALKGITDMVGSNANIGSLMGTMVNGIKPSAFTNGKAGKSDLISQLTGIKGADDYLKYASVAGEMAGMLKGTSFLPGWASQKDGVLDKLQSAASIADVVGGLGGLLGNLDPSALTKGFKKNKSSVSSALNVLSMIK